MRRIETANAPAAIGPYSQAILAGNTVYVSGQLPIDPASGAFDAEDIQGQTRRSLENIRAILQAENLSLENVVKTTALLKNISDFAAMNQVYGQYFQGVCPARAAFQVAALPKDALVEIEAVAVKE